jgi:hypothetical protein
VDNEIKSLIKVNYAVTLDRFCKWVSIFHDVPYNDLIKSIYNKLDVKEDSYYIFEAKELGKHPILQPYIIDFYEKNKLDKERSLIIYDIM